MPERPAAGVLPDSWFERADGVPLSKAPTRALVLSLLAPLEGSLLEIGTGSGGMTVELLRAMPETSRLTLIESLPQAADLTLRNLERAGVSRNFSLIVGAAPDALGDERQNRIFIGGHGKNLPAILERCWQLLLPGGRVVLTAVTQRTTLTALEFFRAAGASGSAWRVASSVSRPAGQDWFFQACNPVDIIWGDKC